MAYAIGPECIEELDGSCVDQCPVDCIYEGGRRRYIQPLECIDCGACLPACPVEAISTAHDAPPQWADDNAAFFNTVLPGRSDPLGSPGSAAIVGKVDSDTELTARTPAKDGGA
jgi:NAD-dependent dihydropyrimidine dehydrogenase PreA subunit